MIITRDVLETRLKWVMFGRLLAALVMLAAMLLIESLRSGGPDAPADVSYEPAYWILITLCGLDLLYMVMVRFRLINVVVLAAVQLSLDVIVVSLLVYCTGIDRLFAVFYFAVVLISAHLLRPAYAFVFASTASVMLACVSMLHFFASQDVAGWSLPYVDPDLILEQKLRLNFLLPYLATFGVSLHVTALLSYLLAREMSRIRILGQEVLDNMAGGVLAFDREGRISYVNGEARRLLEMTAQRIMGEPYATAIGRREIVEALADGISQRSRNVREVQLGGRPLELIVSPIRDPASRELRGGVAILADLTLRKKVERMSKMEERFGAFVELSTSLAHEIRNPLASIKGASQELLEGESLQEDDRSLLTLLLREVNRLDKILTTFLDYASPKPLELRLCNLSRVLEEVAILLESRAGDRPVKIERTIRPDLFCKGDEDRLKQVFLNVGINAVESIRNGRGQIRIGCEPERGGVSVEIEDNGEGIRKGLVNKVFDPFFSTKSSGTGMGLAVARNIIQSHGGRISIDSEVDKGTRCTIWLPS